MKLRNILKVITTALVFIIALMYTFPVFNVFRHINNKVNDPAYYTFSYSSGVYKVDVKDVRDDNTVNFIYDELKKSKNAGSEYPDTGEKVSHEGSFFIVKRSSETYKIATSICWYGKEADICLVEEGSKKYYAEMTEALKSFFKSKFTGE